MTKAQSEVFEAASNSYGKCNYREFVC